MFRIDKQKNVITQIEEKKFVELGFREREHLQEWIAKLPSCLGEELLIIQKEFDGFDGTSERLDLLGIDKSGNLVIIENKLDDSGRDVIWQAIKYASYCSSLTKSEIVDIYTKYLQKEQKKENPKEKILDFMGAQDWEVIELNKPQSQRIFFVAANFRKEVTSTALWLLNYNIKVKCFKVIPYQNGDEIFLDVRQVIPMQDSEDLMIRMAEKNQDILVSREKNMERIEINKKFWGKFLDACNAKSDLFQNLSPSKDSWLWKSAGISGLGYTVVISGTYAKVEFQFNTPDRENNKILFDKIYAQRERIESEIGLQLDWQRGPEDRRYSKVQYELNDVDVYKEEDWDKMITFLITNIEKFVKVFSLKIPELRKYMKA